MTRRGQSSTALMCRRRSCGRIARPRCHTNFVGLRYTRAASGRNHFISFISLISMAGIALGVAALIVVLSVMNGFQEELRARILAVASHIEITGPDNARRLGARSRRRRVEDPARRGRRAVRDRAGDARARRAGARRDRARHRPGARGRGGRHRPPHARRPARRARARRVRHRARRRARARARRARPGERVVADHAAGHGHAGRDAAAAQEFRVVGIFEVGMYEFDSGLALVNLDDAQRLYRLERRVSGVRLKLDDLFGRARWRATCTARSAANSLISDWTRSHANFFRAVEIEKRVMFIILTLIVAVAAFNIVSAQVMVVTDKQADIAILRTLGASPASVMTDLHRAGRADRRDRHADRRGRRRPARAQHRHRAAVDRAHLQRPVPVDRRSTTSASCRPTCAAPT